MEYVEAEGSSIDDAIDRALRQLGVDRDRVDVEILANSTKGIFGIGGKKARVRATMRTPISFTEPDGAATGAIETTSADGGAGGGRAAKPRRTRAAKSERQKTERQKSERAKPAKPHREPVEERPLVEIDADTLEHARGALEQTVRLIGTEASVTVARDDLGISLRIEGDESGILIGRRGQTLDALEYLINRVASRDTGHTTRLVVDSHGYRQRRRESLEAMALRMGERAEQRGKTVTMNPMSPRDRRIVHLALQDNPALDTRSSGKGYFRKLLIIPERS